LFAAKTQLELDFVDGDLPIRVSCTLTVTDLVNPTPFTDASAVNVLLAPTPGASTIPLSVAADLPSGGTAVLACNGNNVAASNTKLNAIQVGSLVIE
jgi:hypothetical protein